MGLLAWVLGVVGSLVGLGGCSGSGSGDFRRE
jgi:hypothetical protein